MIVNALLPVIVIELFAILCVVLIAHERRERMIRLLERIHDRLPGDH